MKKIFTILIAFFAIKSYSQSGSQSYYKRLFDTRGLDQWDGNSTSPDQLEFAWAVPAHMEALVLMYEKTKEPKYAKTLIKCIGNTIDRRDDLRGQVPGLSQISDYRDSIGPAWSNNHYNIPKMDSGATYPHLVHSANILYPMAKFAAIVKKDSIIQNLTYDLPGRYTGQTYNAIANDLILKIKETLNYHSDQWFIEPGSNNTIGYYKERSDSNLPIAFPGVILPFNMQSSVGRVLVQMYRATNENNYLTQVNQIANFIKANTQLNTNLGSNVWTYWKHDTLREDISHADLTAAFPYECNRYSISINGSLIYTTADINAYTKTLTKDIYISPLHIKSGVNYNGENWNIKYNINTSDPTLTPRYGTYTAYLWLYLSQYDDQTLYQIVSDLQAAKNYYSNITVFDSSITWALLSNFEHLVVPVNTDHEYGEDSDWRGVASGNFDGDSDDEFVVIRNFDGLMQTLEPHDRAFRQVTTSKVYGGSNNWKGLAAGDFFGDNKSEIIALNDHADATENGLYVLKVENGNIVEHAKYTGWGTQSEWAGVVAGNFISGGKDDVITVRNFNKEVRVYKFVGTDIQSVYVNTLNLAASSKIKAVASGDLDKDGKDEIVLLVDADDSNAVNNGIHVYRVNDSGVLTKITEFTNWGSASDWKGLAVGDIDADGAAEIIAHRNFDGDYKLFKLNGNTLSGITSEKFPVLQTKNNIMCFGNFDSSTKNEELATLRKDGGIVMFSAANVTNNSVNSMNNRNSEDPCQNELPDVLYSFLKSAPFDKEDSKEIVSVKYGKRK
ncbi:VCBS repeat-containing protein [Chryseobacterium indologenes]|uniref:VCBS repeat-containing protein n=1 Tax=Chryseobacterium indologenes TaxID=253 RepID=A0A411DI08_CHRID|nr:VCBS repeat-containing protein [Chryseobacterium indologenes]